MKIGDNTVNSVRIVSISDSHLGHRNVSVDQMVNGYKNMFKSLEDPSSIDFIVHGGDFFDTGLSLASGDVSVIQSFIRWLLLFCSKNGIRLRVLEGTPSHDRKQSRQFIVINDTLDDKRKTDLKYISTLCIDREEEFGLNFLYVPDEIRANCEETYLDALSLLAEKGLDKVHFAFMHGNFKYQIPAIAHLDAHVEKNYLDIVQYLIFIGHVHTMSEYDRIKAQGSTDRIAHGEEEDKGMFDARVDLPTGNYKLKFIVNKWSAIFKTFDVTGLEVDVAAKKVVKELESFKPPANFRLHIPRDEVFIGMFNELKKQYGEFNWTLKQEKVNKVEDNAEIDIEDFSSKLVNEDTLVKHVKDKLLENGVADVNISESLKLLNECL